MKSHQTEDPEHTKNIRDAATMRVLSHPARWAILNHMRRGRTATATELAEVSGLSPSATSYHLRELAKNHLVEEAPGRGDGRERLWRSAFTTLSIMGGPNSSPETQAAELGLITVVMEMGDARYRPFVDRRNSEPQEWYEASALSSFRILVTAEELTELNEAVQELVGRYSLSARAEPPEGARMAYVTYRSMPAGPDD